MRSQGGKLLVLRLGRQALIGFGVVDDLAQQVFTVIVEKFPEDFAARAKKSAPPPLPPEYTPEELIAKGKISTVPLAHDPGWEKAGTAGTI